jgi:response regulator of citrate/malate metabolism
MKRGRPSKRIEITNSILNVFTSSQTPMTIAGLAKQLSVSKKKPISWNTVQKYLDSLVQQEKVQAIVLPHSKDETKKGLTVYTLKK